MYLSAFRFFSITTVAYKLRSFTVLKFYDFVEIKHHNFITHQREHSVKLNNCCFLDSRDYHSLDNFGIFALDSDSSNIFCKQADINSNSIPILDLVITSSQSSCQPLTSSSSSSAVYILFLIFINLQIWEVCTCDGLIHVSTWPGDGTSLVKH